jgi:hypothetical protein
MKSKAILIAAAIILSAAAFVLGLYLGANKVREGLIANYPLFKKIISNTETEVDSAMFIALNPTEQPALFNLFNTNEGKVELTIPYHAKYGMDLEAKNFKTDRVKNDVELILPRVYLLNYAVAFDKILVNGKPSWKIFSDPKTFEMYKPQIEELVRLPLEKNKSHINEGKKNITTTAMWFLMPYKYHLRVFFNSEEYPLPQVPGINKNVDDYLKEQVSGK